MEYYRTPPSHPQGFQALLQASGLLLLRLTVGLNLLIWHGWRESFGAWLHLWRKTPWAFPETLASLGFPWPIPVAVTLVTVGVLGSIFLILGLLTRISATVLATAAVTAAILYQAYPDRSEKYLLYAGAYAVLVISGSGWLSADGLLRRTIRRG